MQSKRAVIQMDLEGKFIKEFESITAATKQFGALRAQITNIQAACCVRKRWKPLEVRKGNRGAKIKPVKSNIAYGFRWKYKD